MGILATPQTEGSGGSTSIPYETTHRYYAELLQSALSENEERHFSTFKRITKTSANYANPGHIITNIFVRSHFNKNAGTTTNKISQTAKLLPQLRTRIPISLLKKYPREAQTHCERVCDFLQPGYGTHWNIEGEEVVFHDSPSEDPPCQAAAPALHHFRSSSVKQEHSYLQETWNRCLQEEVWIYKYDGQTLSKKVTTPFLDTGYDFAQDKFPYMKEKVATEEEEEELREPKIAADDLEETVKDEEVIRMDRLDPEPALEEFTDRSARESDTRLLYWRFTLETFHYSGEAIKVIEAPGEPELKLDRYRRPGGPTEGLMVFHRRAGSWHPCGWVRAKDKSTVLQLGNVENLECVLLERYVKRNYCSRSTGAGVWTPATVQADGNAAET
ncbi:hypothetical protein Bbelb_278320 [Branchiostoma belcheri]|nr:hypothetical protein Bbelb_278320 [Branchiostoma belcheri]